MWKKSTARTAWAWTARNLTPGRPGPSRRGVDAGIVGNLPDPRGGDAVAKPGQLAVPAPVAPAGILGGHADDQLPAGRRCPRDAPGRRRVV